MTTKTQNPIATNDRAQTFVRWCLAQKGIDATDLDTLQWSDEIDTAIFLGMCRTPRTDTVRIDAEHYRRWLKEERSA